MKKGRIINTLYVVELNYDGCEYHITITNDLKTIYDVDCLTGDIKHGETELLDVIRSIYVNGDLFHN